jgi:hypothetical protein
MVKNSFQRAKWDSGNSPSRPDPHHLFGLKGGNNRQLSPNKEFFKKREDEGGFIWIPS